MRVQVLFFGMLRDLTGRSEESLELPDGASLETLFDHYASQFPRLRAMAGSIVLARNQEFAPREVLLGDGDEVALMPPVSGGSGADAQAVPNGAALGKSGGNSGDDSLGNSGDASEEAEGSSPWLASSEEERGFYALTNDVIDIESLKQRVLTAADGAVIVFEGVVRDQSKGRRTRFLDYDCYVPLALRTMQEIGRGILENHAIGRIAMVHRLGRLEISEASVAILVSSAHRRPAYEASLEAINRLKKLVPVWKKEYFEDGDVWVEGEWEAGVPRGAGDHPA